VFIDEADFDKLKDYFNYKFNCEVKTVKEKNQLKYVCYTRASESAYVFYIDSFIYIKIFFKSLCH